MVHGVCQGSERDHSPGRGAPTGLQRVEFSVQRALRVHRRVLAPGRGEGLSCKVGYPDLWRSPSWRAVKAAFEEFEGRDKEEDVRLVDDHST